jgi:type IV secretory pathway VirB3-like protein
VFGLFHGFGFAGALSEMGVIGEDLGLSRLAFNLGVEVGQIVIVAILFPLFFLVRRAVVYQRIVLPVAAVTMILISSAWVVERAFGLDFQMTKRVRSLLGGLTS